tara:strand:- start:114 stop:353 length:240 start_codon:yes stop_codon:yes gene_type:complete
MFCIFETKTEADAYCATALVDWLATHPGVEYQAQTTAWAIPEQRLTDNKWFVPLCPVTDNSGQTLEDSEEDWFPAPEFP